MSLKNIQFIFNRAFAFTFSIKKWLTVFIVLALCGLLMVFFRALAINAGPWMLLSLTFLPCFLCTGVILSLGVLLIRIYHDEIKNKPVSYREVFKKSWDVIIGSSYFSLPIILCYLVLWMLLGIFVLLTEIPFVGEFFGTVLAFGPFLLNFGSLALGVLCLAMFFLLTPTMALNGFTRSRVSQIIARRLQGDLFSNIFLALIAALPLLFFACLLSLAALITNSICTTCTNPYHAVIEWFFIMIPFTALLSPALIFFFNFSAEAHVLIQRNLKLSNQM
jgi:hypothetical protein